MEEKKKVFAIISFVVAIISIIGNCVGFGLLFGIAAVVLGIVSIKKGEALKGLAIAAIIIGAISILVGLIWLVIGFVSGATVGIPVIIGILSDIIG